MNARLVILSLMTLLISSVSAGQTTEKSSLNSRASDTKQWLDGQVRISVDKLKSNITRPDVARGAVIASPTRQNPDYYFHWTRDAALTMNTVVSLYLEARNDSERAWYKARMSDYIQFSRLNQRANPPGDLGEPKFHVDGRVFTEEWGRPQNDGPALRAVTLIRWAEILLAEGQEAFVRQVLYNPNVLSLSAIKTDLEYVSHQWHHPDYDLWEEVKGTHFYTLMVQRKALRDGADLARRLNDEAAASWYYSQADAITRRMESFWRPNIGYVLATENPTGGILHKHSHLDASVVLAILHGYDDDGFYSFSDERILASMQKMTQTFKDIYPINKSGRGVAIGRYPEDLYAGPNFEGGNPWVLTTLAFADVYCRAARELNSRGDTQRAQNLVRQADDFFRRVAHHANPDGSLSEQINRFTGHMTSVEDLTWNYSAVISAHQACRGM